jgi:hypothetical protein
VPPRRPDEVAAEFIAALHAVCGGEDDPRFGLLGAREQRSRYRETLRTFRRSERRARSEIEDRLGEMLPPGADFRSTVHLVVGGDASRVTISDRDDIAIRLDDFVPGRDDEEPDLTGLVEIVAHELFLTGFRAAGGVPPRPAPGDRDWEPLADRWGPSTVGEVWRASGLTSWRAPAIEARLDAWTRPAMWDVHAIDRYVALLSRVQSEGTAVYVETPLSGRGREARTAAWMESIDDDFAFLAGVTMRLYGGTAAEIDELAAEGFREGGPLHRVGWRIAERIDKYAGRSVLLDTMQDGPLAFFDSYFATHPYGPGQMGSATEEDIRKVIREIRAAGRLDPEAG